MSLDMVDRNSAPEELSWFWQFKRVGLIMIETEKMWLHFSCDVFVAVGCRVKLPNVYEGVIDASVNTYCKVKLIFLQKRL